MKTTMKTKSSRFTKSKPQNKNLLKKLKQTLEEMRPVDALTCFMTEVMRPGEALLKYFIKPSGLTLDQVAKKVEMPEQDINEIIESKLPITSEIASLFQRRLGWPAHALLEFQTLYDIETQILGHFNFLAEFKMHLVGQEIFLAFLKARLKELKRNRAFVKRLLRATLRSRR